MTGKRKLSVDGELWSRWLALERKHPRKVVLIDAATNAGLTVAQITYAATAFAPFLTSCRPGHRVAFRLPNGPDWLALFLALQKAGLAAIPLDGALPREGAIETACRLGARAIYLEGALHHLVPSRPRRDRAACIKVTSGSGSLPKAIACRAAHLLADGTNIIRTMGLRAGDRNLAVIPLGHSYGLGNLLMPLLLQGTALVTAAEYVPRQLLEWMNRHRITVFPGVPALFRVLASLPRESGRAKTLRTAISAGAVLPPVVAQAFHARFGVKVHNFYGSSETGGICYDRTGAVSLTGASVGRPLAGVTVAVKSGRITIAGAAVATRTGRWIAGDLGEWNARGELVLLGRRAQDANIGGKKVHPLEVERLLRSLPGVTDAAVWLVQEQDRDFLAAAVETASPRDEIERALAARLPTWKLPRTLLVAHELLRTARGKLDLMALKNSQRST